MLLLLFISDSLKCFIRYSESEEGRIGRWIEWRMHRFEWNMRVCEYGL